MLTPRKEAEQMAELWLKQLEMEYWESSRCACKELLISLFLDFASKVNSASRAENKKGNLRK
jgi:hypothetical protein